MELWRWRLCLLSAGWVMQSCAVRAADKPAAPLLPRPQANIPAMPPLMLTVVTAGGQRLLLADTDVTVQYDARTKQLRVNHPQWWVINYPLNRIACLEGKSPDAVAELLFGQPARAIRNWYVMTPGVAGPEPPAPTGPAPITLTPNPALIVNNAAPNADDANSGTASAPLKTIGAAVAKVRPGGTIRVYPGIYRETVKVAKSGTAASPIRIEGVRAADGSMPVITGNDRFPPRAWQPVPGLAGVYRADIFTGRMGTVSVGGKALVERSIPQELQAGEFCFNRASKEFLNLRINGDAAPRAGQEQDGRKWQRLTADKDGVLDFSAAYGDEAKNAVIWASAYVWVAPKKDRKEAWDPRFPEPITGRIEVGGEFRAARMSGASMTAQVNKYRVWANGKLLPSVIYSTKDDMQLNLPHPGRNYGFSDTWENFSLNEGWNHLVFEFDTSTRPDKLRFRFGVPKGIESYICSASPPADPAQLGPGAGTPFLSECLLLGPFPSQPDLGVYVRLPGDADPNQADIDLAARGSDLISVEGDFVQMRGFEVRDGAQFQQRAQVTLHGQGILLEGCLVRDSEVKGISFSCDQDQRSAPIVIRNNWVVNPGNTGIGGAGTSDKLTAENESTLASGRSPVLIEHNTIINNNWAGFPSFWESGGIKAFRLTGCVIRYNTVIGGSGPGIWLDWEHYNNRLEGNLFLDPWALCIGIEASPGPNLIANNLSINLRPGPVWFRHAILSWSTDRNWAINNTIDGRWNPLPAWQNKVGADGIYLDEGQDDRHTRWGALTNRVQSIIDNLVIGCHVAVRAKESDRVAANYTDKGSGATALGEPPAFAAVQRNDYRPLAGSSLCKDGVNDDLTKLVTHDFYGLLRFPDSPRSVGAFRCAAESPNANATVVELELEDGTMKRQ